MSKTATLEEMRHKVLDRNRTLSDEVVNVKSLMMDPAQPGRMIVQRGSAATPESFAFDDRVYAQAAGVVYGVPGSYVKKMVEDEKGDPGIAALIFNHHVNQSKDKEVLLRFQKRGEERVLRAVKPASWNPIPYEQSIETLITKFGDDKEVIVERFDDAQLVMNFVTRKLEYKTNPKIHDIGMRDDPIEFGMRFQDSDVGQGDCQVSPYTRRLICLNGATTMTRGIIMHISHSTKESKVPEEVQSTIRQGIEMVAGYAQTVADNITTAQGYMLDVNDEGMPVQAMIRMDRELAITKLEQKHIAEAWETESESIPEASLYRLSNAVTRAGTHADELSDDSRLKLQAVGGRMLEMTASGYRWN